MQAGDLLHDGETETGARDTAGDAGFDPLKAIEDPGQIFPGDADPFVAHRDDDVIAIVTRGNRNRASRRGVLHGIADEVGDRLGEPVAIAVDRAQGGIEVQGNDGCRLGVRTLRHTSRTGGVDVD